MKPYKIILFSLVALSVLCTSCMPTVNEQSSEEGGNSGGEGSKPNPSTMQSIGLFADSGDNLAGIGLHRDGYLTSLDVAIDWFFAPVGDVPGLGNVDYIPATNWDRIIFPKINSGIVAYNPKEGFVRMLVASVVKDAGANVTGVGLYYAGPFFGWDEALELDRYTYEFDAEGGTMQAKLSGNKYATYTVSVSHDADSWLRARLNCSNYDFIYNRIDIDVQPNTSSEDRRTTVSLLTTNQKTTTFTVVQRGRKG